MAWSKNYTQPTNVNGGNEYKTGDHLLKEDLNAIINNVLYIGEQLKVQDYNTNTEYKLFNIVRYAENGHVYMYINATPSTGILPTNTTYWKLLVEKGDKGDKGDKGISFRFLGNWDSGTSYVSNADYIDCVYANGGMYGCILDNSNQPPPNETYWGLILNGIASISKTDTTGNIDTYTITYSNGNTTTFTVTNANIANTTNILIGDGAGNAVDSGISASTILNTLTAVTTTGNPVNIQNTNDGFVDKVKITNDTASAISSPLTGKSVGKNIAPRNYILNQAIGSTGQFIYNDGAVLFPDYLKVSGTSLTVSINGDNVDLFNLNRRYSFYNENQDELYTSFITTDTSLKSVTLSIPSGAVYFRWSIRLVDLSNPVTEAQVAGLNWQVELGSKTDYSPYTATAFSIPLKDTSGTVLDLNPGDVIDMVDGKYHLNDTELHQESQDALRSIPTYLGETNLIGDQPFTFDVTEFQLGLESIDAMLTLPNGTRVNVITKDRLIYITSGEYKGKTLDYVLQELKNEIDGKQDALTFDDTPTSGSDNPVKSGGIKTAIITAIANVESGVIYDQVIRTQTDFETLIASPTWLDAKSVALVGQFTYSEGNNSGIKIPDTVKQIHGFNNAKITITNFVYNATTAKGGLWYDTLPTTPDYSIRDLEVDCTGAVGIGFYHCTNLTNCTGTGTGTGADGRGFMECTNLTNCTGTGTGTGTTIGFSNCTKLTNCTGTGTGAYGYGFRNCTNLTYCTGTGTGTSTYGYGFSDCTNLTNCTGTGTGTGTGTYCYGFGDCTNLTNCTGIGTGIVEGYGFSDCTNLTNCTGTGTGTVGIGFYSITYASNCKDGGSSTNMWGGTNKNINVETCRKTPVNADNTTLNT